MGLPSPLAAVPRPVRDLTVAAAFGGAYLLLAELTRTLGPTEFPLLWAPSGLYVGVLLVSARRRWPLLVCAALGASLGANLLAEHSPTVSLAFAVPSAAEGLLGALIVARLAAGRFSLGRLRDVAALVLGAAAVANGLTALSAAGAAAQTFDVSFADAWLRWWSADALGIVVVAPVVVSLLAGPRAPRPAQASDVARPRRARVAETGVVIAGLGAAALLLAFAEPLSAATVVGGALALPLLLWAGWRWSPRAAALAAVVPALAATYLAPHVADPLGLDTIASAEVVVVQAFLAALVLASLTFAAAAAEGRDAHGRFLHTRRKLGDVVATAPDAYVSIDDAGLITDWSPSAESLLGWPRAQALGRRLHETLMPESGRSAWMAAVERRAGTEDGHGPELLALHQDGRELPVQLAISPSSPEDPSATHLFIRDLSERDRLRDELRAADDLLAQRASELARVEERARQLADGLSGRSEELVRARDDGERLRADLDGERAERQETERALERARAATVAAAAERESLRDELARSEASGEAIRRDLEASGEAVRRDLEATRDAARRDLEAANGARERLERALDAMVMSFAGADRERALFARRCTELIVRYDRVGVCRYASPAAASVVGYEPAELVGTRAGDLLHPDDLHHFDRARDAQDDTTFVARLLCKDRTPVRVEATFSPVRDGRDGRLLALEGSIRLRKEAEVGTALGRLADHDATTGLYSPARFERELRAELATADRYGTAGAVLVAEVDGLGTIDGRTPGDEIVRDVAHALRARLRSTDSTGRTESGQFAVLLRRADGSQATEVAGALLDAVRRLDRGATGAPLGLSASIGIANFGYGRPVQAEELLVEAGIAAQEARHGGGDRALTHDPAGERPATLEEGLGWADQIRTAIQEGRLRLYAEPVVSLAGDPLPRQALSARMESASGELIPPAAFLPAAERCGAAGDVDRWLLRSAIAMLAAEGGAGRLEVSLSTTAPSDPKLHDFLAGELRTAAADPAGLSISIAETAAVDGTDRTTLFLRKLAELDCEVGLDRFGTGVASFLHVDRLPMRYVKLDGALVERLADSESARLVVRSIADVARGLGIRTIAPDVSDDDTLRLLHGLGVGYVQGGALAPARPVSRPPVPGSRPRA